MGAEAKRCSLPTAFHADCISSPRAPTRRPRALAACVFHVEKGTPVSSCARSQQVWLAFLGYAAYVLPTATPGGSLLGGKRGFYSIMSNFQNERLVIGAMAVGESTRALEITRRYAKERKAFGGVLWDKQVIRNRLSMLDAQVEALRQLVYHAAWLMEQNVECVKEVSMVKALAGELNNEVMYACQQFHGGFGYIRDSEIERMVRDGRILAIGGGATEVMLEEVAKRYE